MMTDAGLEQSTVSPSTGRLVGILIAVVSVLIVLMMAHHPSLSAHDAAGMAAELVRKAWLGRVVHGSLIALSLVLLFAFTEFSLHIGLQRPLVRAALIAYAVAIAAGVCAALISGFVVADLGMHYAGGAPGDLETLRHLLYLSLRINQAFADLDVVATSCAIVLWSLALVRRSVVITVAGFVLGGGPALALLAGVLHLDVHGMMLAIVCAMAWNLLLATELLRRKL
ncbi:MAG: hypothetical protein WB784_05540 [Rhodanobacteraceae bacterium]